MLLLQPTCNTFAHTLGISLTKLTKKFLPLKVAPHTSQSILLFLNQIAKCVHTPPKR